MGDDISILLKATLDVNKSIDNINKQILTIQDKLKSINISLNLGDFKSELEKAFGEFETSVKKTKERKIELGGIDEALGKIAGLKGNLQDIFKQVKEIGNVKSLKNIYDTDGNLSGFSVQLETIKNGMKEVSNYNIFGKYNKELGDYEYGLTKVSSTMTEVTEKTKKLTKSISEKPKKSGLQVAIEDTIHQYKIGLMDVETYTNRLQSMIYGGGSNYKSSFMNLGNSDQEKFVNALNQAYEQQNKALNENLNINKKIVQEQDKQNATTIKQNATIVDMNNKLSSIKGKYGSSVNSGEMARVQAMVDALKQLDPATKTYAARVNECQKAISNLNRESADGFKKTQDAISDTTSKTSQLGLTIRTLGQMFMVGSPIYLAQQVFRDMSQSVNELNKSLTDIRIVTGMGVDEVNDLRDSYNKMGKELGATTQEVANSSIEWLRQGKTVAETQELIEASMIGSKLSGVESAQMSEYLTSTLNGMKLSSESAISVVDKMVAVDNAAATSVEELAVALQQTSASAQMAGVDLDQLLGYIGTVSSVTRRSAEVVGQSFKTIFARFQNVKLGEFTEDGVVASDVIKAMDAVGIKVMENETTFRDFGSVIQDLSKKWASLNQAEQISVANALAGVRQRESFLVLMENMEQANELTTKSVESQGLALDRYNIYLQGSEAALNKFKASVEAVFIKSLNSQTVNNVINLGSAMLDFVSSTGGLIPILTQIGGLLMVLKADAINSFASSAIAGVKGIGTAFNMLKANLVGMVLQMKGVQTATTMTAMTMQSMIPIIGALTIVASGLTMAYNAQKQAHEEMVSKAKEGQAQKIQEINDTKSLMERYKELSESGENTKESREELLSIQTKLSEAYGIELRDLDLLNKSYEENAEAVAKAVLQKQRLLDIENDIVSADVNKTLDKAMQLSLKVTDVDMTGGSVADAYDKLNKELQNVFDMSTTDDRLELKIKPNVDPELAKVAIDEMLKQLELAGKKGSKEYTDLAGIYVTLTNAINGVVEQNKIMNSQDVENSIALTAKRANIEDVTKATTEEIKAMESLYISQMVASKGTMYAEQAQREFRDTMAKTNPEYAKSIGYTEELGVASEDTSNNIENLVSQLDEISSKANEQYNSYNLLIEAIEKLGQGHQLTGDEIYALTSAYEELTPKIDKTTGQMYLERDALIELAGKSGEDAQQAITAQINKTKEVAAQSVKRIGMIQDEILAINSAIDAYTMLSNMATTSTGGYRPQGLDDETWAKQAANTRNGVGKYINEIADLYKKAEETASNIGNVDAMIEEKKKKKDKKSDDPFKKAIDNIKRNREQLEKEIAIIKEQMSLDNLMGDTKSYNANADKLSVKLKQMLGLAQKELDAYGGLKVKFTKPEQQSELNDLISESNRKKYEDEQNYISNTIDLLNKKYDLEKRAYDDKVKDLSLEQLRVGEGSERYKQIEEEKYNMLLQLQQSYLEKARQLQAMGFSQNQEDVRKYIDLWKDAEEERLNMVKNIAEAERETQLKLSQDKVTELEKQKKAIEDLTKLTMDMIKKEADAKKKAIQDEINGYKSIIDAKKESLRKEQSDKNYQDGLSEKEKGIKKLEDELLALSGDNSEKAKAQKLKLEEELKKAREELEKYQYDHSIEMREDALDKEFEAFEDEKNDEIKVIEDSIAKEGDLRKQALEMIEKGNKELYDKLIKYNDDYGTGVSTDITNAWDLAQTAMEEYGGTQENLLLTLQNITLEMERQATLQSQITNSTWQDFAKPDDLKPSGGGSSSGSSSSGLSEKGKQQLNQQRYLHEQMVIANETNNDGLRKWVESERKKWGLDPKTGAVVKQFHKGLEYGQIGTGMKPNEVILKAMDDEWVVTNRQMNNITRNITGLINANQQVSNQQPISLTFDKLINVEGNLDKGVDIKAITSYVTSELVNKLSLAGLTPKRR